MKKFCLFTYLFLFTNILFAQKTWVGTTSSFSLASNWSDNATPTTGNSFIFDNTSTVACIVDMPINAISFSINAGYNNVITMGSFSHYIHNNFVISSGTVIATTKTLQVDGNGNFSLSGTGSFTHNGGVFEIHTDINDVYTFSGDIVLNTLEFDERNGNNERIINFGSNLTVNTVSIEIGQTRLISFQGTVHVKSTLDLGDLSCTTVSSNNSATFIFDGPNAKITGSVAKNEAYLPNIVINTPGTYSISKNLDIIGSWTGNQGTLSANSALASVDFYGNVSISGTAVAFPNLDVETSTTTVTFPSNAEVKILSDFLNNGTINAGANSVINMNGSSAQSISGNAFTLGNLKIGSGARTVTMLSPINLLNSLEVGSNATLAAGSNQLNMNADANMKSRVKELGSGAAITGNVNVETYVPGPYTGWALWGINGVNSQNISSWDGQIPMTCFGCFYDVTALTPTFASIQSWNENNCSYSGGLFNTTNLDPGKGFWVYVGSGPSSTTDFILNNSGTLVQGPVSVPISLGSGTCAGYNLVSNPYPSPISWTDLYNANSSAGLSDTYYVWNADMNTGSGNFAYFSINGGGSVPANALSDTIPAGQAFYISVGTSSTTLNFTEAMKAEANKTNMSRTKGIGGIRFLLRLDDPSGNYDETAIRFSFNSTTSLDKEGDAQKIFTTPGYQGYPEIYSDYTTISSKVEGIDYAINSLPPVLSGTMAIPILVKVVSSGNYKISFVEEMPYNSCIVLHDKLNDSYHDLKNSAYNFSINDSTSSARFELIVCENIQTIPNALKDQIITNKINIRKDEENVLVETKFNSNTTIKISVFNVLGQKLTEDRVVNGTETQTEIFVNAKDQLIFVSVEGGSEKLVKKIVMGN